MRKAISFLVFLTVLGVGGYYILQNYFPNLVPPSKDIKQFLPATKQTDTPLQIPDGNTLDVFTDLYGEQPRVLTFDSRGTLFASLTNVGKVIALPDFDGNLRPERKIEIITKLNKPHGIEFHGGYLYVAETNKVSRYKYNPATMSVGAKEVLFKLPGGGKNFTRTIKVGGDKLYTSVGSSCDACIEKDEYRASILVSELNGSNLKVFARGLRNTVFFDIDNNGKIWGTDVGRSGLGDSLPPDEINLIEEGKDYGWPYCYGNNNRDLKMESVNPISCEHYSPPVYELPAHSAPFGIIFDSGGNLLVALHGSTISGKSFGYKVVKLSVFAESIAGEEDYLSGFVQGTNEVLGRPTGLVIDKNGNLFISDDKSGMIYVLRK